MFVPPWAAVMNLTVGLLGMPVAALVGVNGSLILIAVVIFHIALALIHAADDQFWSVLADSLIELVQTKPVDDWIA